MNLEAQKRIFEYLARNVGQDKDEFNSVKSNCGISDEDEFKLAIVELCALGLIVVNFVVNVRGFIHKEKEFYHAQRLGFDSWLAQYNADLERERCKIEHDAKISEQQAKAAKYWRLPYVLSTLALIVAIIALFI